SCKYLSSDNTCSIYEDRPDICRVDLQYKLFFSTKMTWNKFIQVNVNACTFLQNEINS
ncbi:YkgJ family cysteine cluster protein, partial [Anaerorhabdus sp.]|uniref:YkgJ family cysteine cluster protein n=1 Tax=Anaerorhabdus sp. TaxID=1872524 RepID=UPI003FA5B7D3